MPEIQDSLMQDAFQSPSVANDRYKTLFERVNASAFLAELSGQVIEANHRSAEFLGYEWHELHRLSLMDLLPAEMDWAGIRDELAARGGLNVETDCICKDGSRRPVEVSLSVFRMETRIVMFVLLWDIRERRIAQQRLKESEKKYRGLFEYATDGIIVLDARGDIVDVNTRVCELLDKSKQDLQSKNLFNMNLLTARSLPVVVSEFEELLSEKKAASYTTEVQTTKGKILEVEISSFFLVKKDNEVDNFVLILHDVTARNESERIQAREHELFRALLDNVPESVYFKDAHHRFILVNKAKAEHAHVRPDQMVGKTDADFYPAEIARQVQEDDQRILLSGVPIINKVERIADESNQEKYVMVTKIPRYSIDGDIIGTMGISRDITIWHQAERESAKTQGLLRVLIDALPDLIAVKDTRHRYVVVNQALASWAHASADQLAGKTGAEAFPGEPILQSETDETMVIASMTPSGQRAEKIRDPDGKMRRYTIHTLPWKTSEGTIAGTVTIMHPLT